MVVNTVLNYLYNLLILEPDVCTKKNLHKFSDLPSCLSKLINLYDTNKLDFPRVLILGDSVSERISQNDKDVRSLAQMLKEKISEDFSVEYITHSAYNSMIYYYIFLALKVLKNKPRIIIFPINIRSFSPQWDLHPLWQFNDEISAIQKYIKKRKEISFEHDNNKYIKFMDYKKYDNIKINYPNISLKSISEFRKIISIKPQTQSEIFSRFKHIFIFHYMFKLTEHNRKIIFLRRIVKLLSSMNIKYYLYFTPINYKAGERLIGKKFINGLNKNLIFIKNTLMEFNNYPQGYISDHSLILSSNYFFHKYNSTEHLNEKGRQILADKVIKNMVKHKILEDN